LRKAEANWRAASSRADGFDAPAGSLIVFNLVVADRTYRFEIGLAPNLFSVTAEFVSLS
jgi:hypothetical protein